MGRNKSDDYANELKSATDRGGEVGGNSRKRLLKSMPEYSKSYTLLHFHGREVIFRKKSKVYI